MNYSSLEIWTIIGLMALGSFLIRFSFLGLVGNREMPKWFLRHLRYTPLAVMPGLIAPLVLWPAGTEGQTDPARLIAAAVAVTIGITSKNLIAAVTGGMVALYGAQYFLG